MKGRPISGWSLTPSARGLESALLGCERVAASAPSLDPRIEAAAARWGRSRVAALWGQSAWSMPARRWDRWTDGPVYARVCPEHDGQLLTTALGLIEHDQADAVVVVSIRADIEAALLLERAADTDWVLSSDRPSRSSGVSLDLERLTPPLRSSMVAAVALVVGGLETGMRWPSGEIDPEWVDVSVADMSLTVAVRE